MSEFTGLFDYKNFVNFSNDLEEFALTSDNFLCERLLLSIEKNFGISNILVSLYDGKRVTGAITRNQTRLLSEPYLSYYYKNDPVSSYITNTLTQDSSYALKALRATDIFPSIDRFEESEYCSYLKIADLYYLAVVPVPWHNFRLCVYKRKEMSNFSDLELNAISSIASLISKKFNTCRYIKMQQIINRIKNTYLDNSSTGLVILNSNFEIVEYNEASLPWINTISEQTELHTFFSDCFMQKYDFAASRISSANKYNLPKDLHLHFSTYMDLDYPNLLQRYYIVTFKDKDSSHATATKNFVEHFKVSQREFEIIELLSQGLKYQEVADQLFISLNTLRTHVKNIYSKLDIDNQRTLLSIYNQYKCS